jgi:hypothetical protein
LNKKLQKLSKVISRYLKKKRQNFSLFAKIMKSMNGVKFALMHFYNDLFLFLGFGSSSWWFDRRRRNGNRSNLERGRKSGLNI